MTTDEAKAVVAEIGRECDPTTNGGYETPEQAEAWCVVHDSLSPEEQHRLMALAIDAGYGSARRYAIRLLQLGRDLHEAIARGWARWWEDVPATEPDPDGAPWS
jgi:hypothetical protein